MILTKMQGAGNDYLYLDLFRQPPEAEDYRLLARRVSDRHFGLGSDGLVIISPSDAADVRMKMYNRDGSVGKACGNALRCVARYAAEHGLADPRAVRIETDCGVRLARVYPDGTVSVTMGAPVWEGAAIPTVFSGDFVTDRSVALGGRNFTIHCVSFGNPHCAVFLPEIEKLSIALVGPAFEHSTLFPEGINTSFVRVLGEDRVQVRVWERGSGETLACGSAACAVAAIAERKGFCRLPLAVEMRGGVLTVGRQGEEFTLTGPAVAVYTTCISLADILQSGVRGEFQKK